MHMISAHCSRYTRVGEYNGYRQPYDFEFLFDVLFFRFFQLLNTFFFFTTSYL